MNLFAFSGFADSFYMFGGDGEYNEEIANDFYHFNLKTRKWRKVNEDNENYLNGSYSTTTIVSKSDFESSVYVIGGFHIRTYKRSKDIMKF